MRLFLIAVALVAASATQAVAQGLVTQKALSLEMAQAIGQGTVEQCREGRLQHQRFRDRRKRTAQGVRSRRGQQRSAHHRLEPSQGVHGSDICLTMGDVAGGSQGVEHAMKGSPMPNVEGTTGLGGGVPIKIA